MSDRDELAMAWARDLQIAPTPAALALASRRIRACGRLATLRPLLHMGWIVAVDVVEHGAGPWCMDRGTAHATVWVEASDETELQRRAGQVHAVVREHAIGKGLLLTAAVGRATGWVRLRARLQSR